jgi:hypothetical protein
VWIIGDGGAAFDPEASAPLECALLASPSGPEEDDEELGGQRPHPHPAGLPPGWPPCVPFDSSNLDHLRWRFALSYREYNRRKAANNGFPDFRLLRAQHPDAAAEASDTVTVSLKEKAESPGERSPPSALGGFQPDTQAQQMLRMNADHESPSLRSLEDDPILPRPPERQQQRSGATVGPAGRPMQQLEWRDTLEGARRHAELLRALRRMQQQTMAEEERRHGGSRRRVTPQQAEKALETLVNCAAWADL